MTSDSAKTASTAISQKGLCEKQIDSQRGEDRVQGDEVGDGAPAQAHTGISYFSKRR